MSEAISFKDCFVGTSCLLAMTNIEGVNMKAVIDIEKIKEILPHRYPFLLVDRIVDITPRQRIVGLKNVTVNEAYFLGHFPSRSIMPGVLIIEALAQTCGILVLQEEENKGKLAFFASINNAKFRRPVTPGDTLMLEIELTNYRTRIFQCHGVAKVDNEIACEADLLFSVMGER